PTHRSELPSIASAAGFSKRRATKKTPRNEPKMAHAKNETMCAIWTSDVDVNNALPAVASEVRVTSRTHVRHAPRFGAPRGVRFGRDEIESMDGGNDGCDGDGLSGVHRGDEGRGGGIARRAARDFGRARSDDAIGRRASATHVAIAD